MISKDKDVAEEGTVDFSFMLKVMQYQFNCISNSLMIWEIM